MSAMARVDRRDTKVLRLIARMSRRCARRDLFSQETLATTMNAIAKLDFNHPRLGKAFEDATIKKLDRAIAMGPDYRASNLRGQDVFDLQALVTILHTFVCLIGAHDSTITNLLTLLSWSKNELSDYQRRRLKTVCIVLRHQYKRLYNELHRDVKEAIHIIENTPVTVATNESRWAAELRTVLKKMDIRVELKPVVDDQVLDIFFNDEQRSSTRCRTLQLLYKFYASYRIQQTPSASFRNVRVHGHGGTVLRVDGVED